jgi:hypothetical protein
MDRWSSSVTTVTGMRSGWSENSSFIAGTGTEQICSRTKSISYQTSVMGEVSEAWPDRSNTLSDEINMRGTTFPPTPCTAYTFMAWLFIYVRKEFYLHVPTSTLLIIKIINVPIKRPVKILTKRNSTASIIPHFFISPPTTLLNCIYRNAAVCTC